ncbi:MAG TPA: hypothetical protein DGT23_29660 [Micromonosporaceae bacterium]|nr:hypothetical protein [Micromonosporaceae bacterium]
MRVDPTECAGAVGGWKFDLADGRHAGWEKRFNAFMRPREARLLGYVKHLAEGFTQAELDAEHITQVTWSRAAFRWPAIEAIENTKQDKAMAYLYVIARNLVMRAYAARAELAKQVRVEPGWTSAGQRALPVADQAVGMVDAVVLPEWEDDLLDQLSPGPALQAWRNLPGLQQAALYLFEVEGMKAKEIAKVLGVSPGDVNTHKYRALNKLREWVPSVAASGLAVGGAVTLAGGLFVGAREMLRGAPRVDTPLVLTLAIDAALAVAALLISFVAGRRSRKSHWRKTSARLDHAARRLPIGRSLLLIRDHLRRRRRAARHRAARLRSRHA